MAHLHIFSSLMVPLDQIVTNMDRTSAEIWAHRGSVSYTTVVGPIIREAAWIFRKTRTHKSVARISGGDTHEANETLCLTHLNVAKFTRNFNYNFT